MQLSVLSQLRDIYLTLLININKRLYSYIQIAETVFPVSIYFEILKLLLFSVYAAVVFSVNNNSSSPHSDTIIFCTNSP